MQRICSSRRPDGQSLPLIEDVMNEHRGESARYSPRNMQHQEVLEGMSSVEALTPNRLHLSMAEDDPKGILTIDIAAADYPFYPESGATGINRDIKVFNNSMFKDDIVNARVQQMNELKKPFFNDEEERSYIHTSPTKDFDIGMMFRNMRPHDGANFSVPALMKPPESLEGIEPLKVTEPQRNSDQLKTTTEKNAYNIFHCDSPVATAEKGEKTAFKIDTKPVDTTLPLSKVMSNENSLLSHGVSLKHVVGDAPSKSNHQSSAYKIGDTQIEFKPNIVNTSAHQDGSSRRLVPSLELPLKSMIAHRDVSTEKAYHAREALKSMEKLKKPEELSNSTKKDKKKEESSKNIKKDKTTGEKKDELMLSIPFALNDDSNLQ